MENAKPTLSDYRKLVKKELCRWDNTQLPMTVLSYDHQDGYEVEGFEKKQWLYLRCVKCDYDWSLWKLGVPRA